MIFYLFLSFVNFSAHQVCIYLILKYSKIVKV